MKASDWVCPHCGCARIKTSEDYLCCERGCGRLIPAPKSNNLCRAKRFDYKRFVIQGEDGYWERVPNSGYSALESRPALGVVVARAPSGRVCAFCEAKPPRGKKTP